MRAINTPMKTGVLIILFFTVLVAFAQPDSHPAAEEALASIVLEQDFGPELKYTSRDVVTIADNDRVPGLNGLLFMRWQGDDAITEVTASVQWFEQKKDLEAFILQTPQLVNLKQIQFGDTTLWEIKGIGYAWSDGQHFVVSLGGRPIPPDAMVEAWLRLIHSRIDSLDLRAPSE